MKNSIVIGPIKKASPKTPRAHIINDRLSKMKVGNFFEVTGLSTKNEVINLRGTVGYFAKKNNIKTITNMIDGVLRVERVKSVKTKEASEVK